MHKPHAGVLWNVGVNEIHLAFSFSPFGFDCIGMLMIKLSIVLNVFKAEKRALVLMRVVFDIQSGKLN